MTTYEVGGRTIEITHPDRVLFPDDGLTKADMAEYHHQVAPTLVRHLADRPLMLQRFPEGIDGAGFYQKEAGRGVPSWVRTFEARKEGGTVNHPVVDDEAALLALTNLGTISFHRWPSRVDDLEHPDLLLVDLDPSDDDFDGVRRAARWTRDVLDELDLASYLQVTGSRGIHVVTPVDRGAPTEAAAAFAQRVARLLSLRHPDELTDEGRKAKRKGRLYVDVARNGWAQTAVTPYSVRPRPRSARGHADHVGRARGRRPPARRVHHRHRAGPARRGRGPVGRDGPPRPLAPEPLAAPRVPRHRGRGRRRD